MEVYIILYDYRNWNDEKIINKSICEGVCATKALAEMKIQKIIQEKYNNGTDIYGREFIFEHINDRWSLIAGYDTYRIEKHIMELSNE